MSHNLALWEPGGTEFKLSQTPTRITDAVLRCATTGGRAATYLAWLADWPEPDPQILAMWKDHARDLIDWLLAHPDHSWVST